MITRRICIVCIQMHELNWNWNWKRYRLTYYLIIIISENVYVYILSAGTWSASFTNRFLRNAIEGTFPECLVHHEHTSYMCEYIFIYYINIVWIWIFISLQIEWNKWNIWLESLQIPQYIHAPLFEYNFTDYVFMLYIYVYVQGKNLFYDIRTMLIMLKFISMKVRNSICFLHRLYTHSLCS